MRLKNLVQNVVDKSYSGSYPYVGLENVDGGSGEIYSGRLPVKHDPSALRHESRDVLFGKLRPYLAKSFLAAGVGIGSSELLVLRSLNLMEPKLLLYSTLSSPWLEWAEMTSYGTKMPRTSWEAMSGYMMWVPDLDEQRRIADFLDVEVGRIDQTVSVRRRQWSVLEERESSLLSERLIPGSVERPAGNFPWPWLPVLPADIPMVRLGYVCQTQGGVTVDSSRDSSETDVTRPYLRVANVKADRLELDSVTEITVPKAVADRSTLQPGDVLMTEGGDIDKLGRGVVWNGELTQALHQNHVFALRPDHERLNAEYLALLTRSLHGRCYFEATGVKSTNLASTSSSKVRSFPVPLVSLGEQRKIVAEVNSALDEMSRLRSAVQNQIDLLQERKRALITAAVTGQIDVTTARGADVS